MGLLDGLFNLNPEQNQGLLAAAGKMLEMSGPSRTPTSLGQILGASYGAYNDATNQAQQLAALRRHQGLQEQLLDWKIKDAEADFGHQQGTRAQQARIAERIGKLYGNGDPTMDGGPGGMPGAMPDPAGGLSSTPASTPDPRLRRGGLEELLWPSQAPLSTFNGSQPSMTPGLSSPPGHSGGGQTYQGMPGPAASGQPTAPSGLSDWLNTGLPPVVAMSMARGAYRPNQTQQSAERMLAAADIYASENDFDNAEKRYKAAAALLPQVERIEVATDPRTNQPVRLITYKNGYEEVSPFGAKPDWVELDTGGEKRFIDRNKIAPGAVYEKTQTPDSRAVDARFTARVAGSGGSDASLDEETLDMMADQALRGDTSVFKNLGRGAQGSANLVELRSRITQKAKALNISGADLAAITADYGGLVNGLRVSSNISARVENAISEARELAPLAVAAGREVARSGLLPFGKAQVMFDTQTNDPALKKFAAANVGFVQAYAGAMARGQKPTVHDKEHAEKLISEATSQKAYEAVMDQLMLEMDAASRAPQKVREHLRNEIGGRGSHGGDHGNRAPGGSPAAKPVITLSDIAETARKSRRSTREVTAAFRAKGYKIQGDK